MASKEIKVEPKTVKQMTEIIERNPEGQQLIKKTLVDSIDKLWKSVCQPKATLIFIDTDQVELKPKTQYCELIKNMTGSDGPYTAIKTCKSWVGLSDGVYQLKDSNSLIPVSWFTPVKTRNFSLQTLLTIALIIFSLIQSIILLVIIAL